MDGEKLIKSDSYMGRRKHRGLFVSREGIKLNADVNGASNIARKVFPKFKYDGIEAFIVSPEVFNVLKPSNSISIRNA